MGKPLWPTAWFKAAIEAGRAGKLESQAQSFAVQAIGVTFGPLKTWGEAFFTVASQPDLMASRD
jgi:hypothetical protein